MYEHNKCPTCQQSLAGEKRPEQINSDRCCPTCMQPIASGAVLHGVDNAAIRRQPKRPKPQRPKPPPSTLRRETEIHGRTKPIGPPPPPQPRHATDHSAGAINPKYAALGLSLVAIQMIGVTIVLAILTGALAAFGWLSLGAAGSMIGGFIGGAGITLARTLAAIGTLP